MADWEGINWKLSIFSLFKRFIHISQLKETIYHDYVIIQNMIVRCHDI